MKDLLSYDQEGNLIDQDYGLLYDEDGILIQDLIQERPPVPFDDKENAPESQTKISSIQDIREKIYDHQGKQIGELIDGKLYDMDGKELDLHHQKLFDENGIELKFSNQDKPEQELNEGSSKGKPSLESEGPGDLKSDAVNTK